MLSPICNSQAKPGQFPYEQSSNERNERTKWNKNREVYWLNGRTLMANECTDYDKYMACSITKWIDCMLTIRTYDVRRCIYNQISEFHQSAVLVVSVGCDFLHSPSTWVDHLIYLHDRLDGCVYTVHRTVHAWYPIDYRQKQPKSTVFGWLLFISFAFPWKFESDLNEYYTWIWIKPSWRSKFTQYMYTRILCCQMRHTSSLLCTQCL